MAHDGHSTRGESFRRPDLSNQSINGAGDPGHVNPRTLIRNTFVHFIFLRTQHPTPFHTPNHLRHERTMATAGSGSTPSGGGTGGFAVAFDVFEEASMEDMCRTYGGKDNLVANIVRRFQLRVRRRQQAELVTVCALVWDRAHAGQPFNGSTVPCYPIIRKMSVPVLYG